MRHDYVELGVDQVAPAVRGAAEAAFRLARIEQKLAPTPAPIRYFRPPAPGESARIAFTLDEDVAGTVRDGFVWIRGDLSLGDIVKTTAHEVYHLAHRAETSSTMPFFEDLAEGYGKAFAQRHAVRFGLAPASQLRRSLRDDSHWSGGAGG